MLPVTTQPPYCPGFWGSPYGKPRTIALRHHPHGYPLSKGIWMVRTGANRVELRYQERCWEEIESWCGPPGTGLIRPPGDWRPPEPPRPPRPPRPPYRPHYHFDDDGGSDDVEDVRTDQPLPVHSDNRRPGGGGVGDNSEQRWELIRQNSTGVVYADGWSVRIIGAGDAVIIQVF